MTILGSDEAAGAISPPLLMHGHDRTLRCVGRAQETNPGSELTRIGFSMFEPPMFCGRLGEGLAAGAWRNRHHLSWTRRPASGPRNWNCAQAVETGFADSANTIPVLVLAWKRQLPWPRPPWSPEPGRTDVTQDREGRCEEARERSGDPKPASHPTMRPMTSQVIGSTREPNRPSDPVSRDLLIRVRNIRKAARESAVQRPTSVRPLSSAGRPMFWPRSSCGNTSGVRAKVLRTLALRLGNQRNLLASEATAGIGPAMEVLQIDAPICDPRPEKPRKFGEIATADWPSSDRRPMPYASSNSHATTCGPPPN